MAYSYAKDKYSGVYIQGSTFPDDSYKSVKVGLSKAIKEEYLPALEEALPNIKKGLKLLMIAMTSHEGFNKNTRSYKTNNPGNIGNTDSGSNKGFPTLKDGIKAQANYLTDVAKGRKSAYPIGKDITIKPYYSPEIENNPQYGIPPYLPGYKFKYTGQLDQFIKIYATGARVANGYINHIVSYFAQNDIKIYPSSKLIDIIETGSDLKEEATNTNTNNTNATSSASNTDNYTPDPPQNIDGSVGMANYRPDDYGKTPIPIDPKTMSGKIKLVKKSGPGELKGVVEKDLSNGVVSFDGLQIDQAGTYIIEVIPTNPDLEKSEIEIIVEKEPEIIEQNKPDVEEKNAKNNRPIIAQIDPPNQKISPIKRDLSTNLNDNLDSAWGIGIKPIVAYGGKEAAKDTDIKSLILSYNNNIPSCKVRFRDAYGAIKDEPPRDDSKFEIFLNSQDVDIKSIHLVFKIVKQQEIDQVWYFEGMLNVDELYAPSSKSYDGTSFEVLRKIAKKLNLGFNSNIENTDDNMRWINVNKTHEEFIRDIVKHSYKDDKSFMYGYLDFYYCYNYVDLEKEYSRDTADDYMVQTGESLRLAKSPETKFSKLLLTNEPSQSSSSGFFINYKLLNQSTDTKIKEGYRTVARYYDEEKKSILEFEIDSQTKNTRETIPLKGESGNNNFIDKKVVKKFLGRFDTDNVHKNYIYAVEQNRKNLDNLTSVVVELTLPNANYNLYRLQKVPILFYNIDSSITKKNEIDYRLSGGWIIIDISFELVKNKFLQKLICCRKEFGKTPDELKDAPKSNPEQKEGNKNVNNEPENKEVKANSKYKVGDKIEVVKNDGNKYEIEVTKILENGNEIEGKMKRIKSYDYKS